MQLIWIGVPAAIVGGTTAAWLLHHSRRTRVYHSLAKERQGTLDRHADLVPPQQVVPGLAETFRRDFLVRCENFLPEPVLRQLQAEARANQARAERMTIPMHKKGGTLSYEALHRHAPICLSVYHSLALRRWVASVVGQEVHPTADHDQSACSVLYYDQAGDHINWHFDHNYYKGRHFTALLSLVNRSAGGSVSSSSLLRKEQDGTVVPVDTSENALVLFEGTRVLHRASPASDGDLRIILSMTFCTDPRVGCFSEGVRRIKDTAYYGLRALWD